MEKGFAIFEGEEIIAIFTEESAMKDYADENSLNPAPEFITFQTLDFTYSDAKAYTPDFNT